MFPALCSLEDFTPFILGSLLLCGLCNLGESETILIKGLFNYMIIDKGQRRKVLLNECNCVVYFFSLNQSKVRTALLACQTPAPCRMSSWTPPAHRTAATRSSRRSVVFFWKNQMPLEKRNRPQLRMQVLIPVLLNTYAMQSLITYWNIYLIFNVAFSINI